MGRILAVVLAGGIEPLGKAAFGQGREEVNHRDTGGTEAILILIKEHDPGPIL